MPPANVRGATLDVEFGQPLQLCSQSRQIKCETQLRLRHLHMLAGGMNLSRFMDLIDWLVDLI